MAQYTPMIQQYLQVKAEAQDAFLFFRLGDFYELFFEDAINASRELEITLTARNGGTDDKIPMCGVPYHSADNYIQRLIEKGYKVAICEQMEDASVTKGMVRREIVRVVTPGTVMEGKTLGDKSNNYMVCLTGNQNTLALAACDLSTGELYVTSVPYSKEWLTDEIGIYEPSELVGDAALLETVEAEASPIGRPVVYTSWTKNKEDLVRQQFGEAVWARLEPERQACIARLFSYLSETQKRSLGQLTQISTYEPDHYMILDPLPAGTWNWWKLCVNAPKKVHYSGCLIGPRRPWVQGCCVAGSISHYCKKGRLMSALKQWIHCTTSLYCVRTFGQNSKTSTIWNVW